MRRAISAAYYGVFHAIAAELADDLVGRTQRQTALYALVYRSIDHRSLRDLCEIVKKATPPEKLRKYAPAGGFDNDWKALAEAVLDLQEKRHSADYDPLFRVTTSDAALAVATGRTALRRLRSASREQIKAFLLLLKFSPR